jgi:hypothetical protein
VCSRFYVRAGTLCAQRTFVVRRLVVQSIRRWCKGGNLGKNLTEARMSRSMKRRAKHRKSKSRSTRGETTPRAGRPSWLQLLFVCGFSALILGYFIIDLLIHPDLWNAMLFAGLLVFIGFIIFVSWNSPPTRKLW